MMIQMKLKSQKRKEKNKMLGLKHGVTSPKVAELQQILIDQGFLDINRPTNNFRDMTLEALVYFQQTHLNQEHKPLRVTGTVTEETLWALNNPSGVCHEGLIDPVLPLDLPPQRGAVLREAISLYRQGVREIPDGSNRGPDLDKITRMVGRPTIERGPPWCAYYVSYVMQKALSAYPIGRRTGSTFTMWQLAQERGTYFEKEKYIPLPGDVMLMQYRDSRGNWTRRGHVGFVFRVEIEDGRWTKINTVEGNTGNAVRVLTRDYDQETLIGFINTYSAVENDPSILDRATLIQQLNMSGRNLSTR